MTYAQSNKIQKGNLDILKKHIEFLSDDKLEGRRTGMPGERMAADYVIKQFKKAGITATKTYPDYLQPFEVKDGKKIERSELVLNGHSLKLSDEFFPLSWSANGVINLTSEIILFDVSPFINENNQNPHFDLRSELYDVVKSLNKNNSVIIIHSGKLTDNLKFESTDKNPPLSVPVFYLTQKGTEFLKVDTNVVRGEVLIQESSRTGHNVIGYINNSAKHTVVLGAHYDHLGFGEDGNSLYTGKTNMIHNGADDNASGTAALLLLADRLKKSGLQNNNYMLVAFSGEELGLFGSKYFTEHLPENVGDINYMINMDMLGRLNDSTHALTIGGFGTSPTWNTAIKTADVYFKIKIDSSGSGPSDHTSFYRKNIPVLFFFTGTHSDYHKPSDDAANINYPGEIKVIDYIFNVIKKTNQSGKIEFSKTRELVSGGSSFKVTLGIMPDYTFTGNGVKVDGVSPGRPAEKAGILQGDVIYKLGDFDVHDVQTYMQALNKFDKKQTTNVFINRSEKQLIFTVTF